MVQSLLQNKRRVRFIAILWTLLIFLLCLIPGRDIPDVHIPLIDKWVHFVLFGLFSLLWLLSFEKKSSLIALAVFAASILVGWCVELLQGQLSFLGRSYDPRDILADGIGGFLGVVLFMVWHRNEK
ncbi:MAG: VanZ family protein [Bacteroidetes bacterium]|nr:VanZ family protein [Bacteroidota bacterium]MBS1739137.1 VanZ family protein [Bacteroidota bacterium]